MQEAFQIGVGYSNLIGSLYRILTKLFFPSNMIIVSSLIYFYFGATTIAACVISYYILLSLPYSKNYLYADQQKLSRVMRQDDENIYNTLSYDEDDGDETKQRIIIEEPYDYSSPVFPFHLVPSTLQLLSSESPNLESISNGKKAAQGYGSYYGSTNMFSRNVTLDGRNVVDYEMTTDEQLAEPILKQSTTSTHSLSLRTPSEDFNEQFEEFKCEENANQPTSSTLSQSNQLLLSLKEGIKNNNTANMGITNMGSNSLNNMFTYNHSDPYAHETIYDTVDSQSETSTSKANPSAPWICFDEIKVKVWRKVWKLELLIVFIFFQSLALWPSVITEIPCFSSFSSMNTTEFLNETKWWSLILLFLYAVFDVVGRLVVHLRGRITSSNIWICIILRLIYFPLLISLSGKISNDSKLVVHDTSSTSSDNSNNTNSYWKNDLLTFLLVSSFGYTNGYLGSMCIIMCNEQVDVSEHSYTGQFSALALIVGTVFGSSFALFIENLI